MRWIYVLIVFSLIACASRNNADDKSSSAKVPTEKNQQADSTLSFIDERMKDADSIVFYFYKDPHGADSLRYTRFYTVFSTTESTDMGLLKTGFNAPAKKYENVWPCRSEGKMFLYKQGQVFQTVYFSGKDEQCSFLYIIKEGYFYYAPIDGGLLEKLKKFEQNSREE